MLIQSEQVILLHRRYTTEGHPREENILDERQHHYRAGQQRILAPVGKKFISIGVEMEPGKVEKKVVSLLNWLVGQKICWMSSQRRKRSSRDTWKAWQVEGSIDQIDTILSELSQTCSSEWMRSSARHGCGFQVFHCRDFVTGSTGVNVAHQYWCGLQRELWYQEVAIISLKHAERQQEQIFQLTNHIDQPWTRHREVVWSLDMHALTTLLAQEMPFSTGPSYPRSTSVGDVVISLLSGTTWIVAPRGFQMIIPDSGRNNS